MGANSMIKPSLFMQKCLLLCRGVNVVPSLEEKFQQFNLSLNKGRKGGAGPAGGRYFCYNDTVVNIPLYYTSLIPSFYDWTDIDTDLKCTFIDSTGQYAFDTFSLIDLPKFYNQKSSENIPFYKIGLIHSRNVFSTTVHQKCCHWETGNQCKFCGIEYSLQSGATIEEKTGEQLIEAIEAAKQENPALVSHITLTAGTAKNQIELIRKYSDITSKIHTRFPKHPIHIQVDPLLKRECFEQLKNAGVSTIGIHIEILDDTIRKEICPGKSNTPYETYIKAWKLGVETFGTNNVSSFVVVGYLEQQELRKKRIRDMIQIGVIPFILPVRYIPQNPNPVPMVDPFELYQLTYYAASEMMKNNMDPFKNSAGCVLCGACGPILDAYSFVKSGKPPEIPESQK